MGTCIVPLVGLLRQGEVSKVVAGEYDIGGEDGTYKGGLQVLMVNEGRKTGEEPAEKKRKTGVVKKKVLSKPIENV